MWRDMRGARVTDHDRAQMGPTPRVPIVTLVLLVSSFVALVQVAPDTAAALAGWVESVAMAIVVGLSLVGLVAFLWIHWRERREVER